MGQGRVRPVFTALLPPGIVVVGRRRHRLRAPSSAAPGGSMAANPEHTAPAPCPRKKPRSARLLGCKRPRNGSRSLPPFSGRWTGRGRVGRKAGLCVAFWRQRKSQRPGGGGGRPKRAQSRGRGLSPPAPALVLPAQRAGKTPPPRKDAPTFPLPMSNRRRAGGGALARGSRSPLGHAGGRRRLAAGGRPCGPPPGRQTKARGRGQGPRPRAFRALRALPPPPRAAGIFHRPNDPSTTPILPRLPTNKTSPPLPMSGGPAPSAGKRKKSSSWFSPAFFKSGRGSRGRAPGGARGGAPVTTLTF